MPSAGDKILISLVPRVIALAEETSDSPTVSTVETSIMSVNTSLVAGQVYEITVDTRAGTTVSNDDASLRIRENNASGNQLQGTTQKIISSGQSLPVHMTAFYTALATGSKTFVVTLVRSAGTGALSRRATVAQPSFLKVALTGL